VILAALALAVSAPSFDCAKAKTAVEKIICGDDQLAHLDVAVALDYLQMPEKDRANHRAWLRSRDACTTRACLLEQYETRMIDAVIEGAPGVRHYRSRPNRGEFDILSVGNGWYVFSAIGLWPTYGGSVNTAEAGGSFRLDAKGVATRSPTNELCGWRVQRLPNDRWRISTLTAKGTDESECYGLNATIDGTYSRSERKPK
jgi:hypothetical protein